jgi:hypothetical protein
MTADEIKLEAAFALIGKKLGTSELAEGLGWPLSRTQTAIEALRKRLQGSGRRLQLSGGRYAIRPAAGLLTKQEIQRLERAASSAVER